MPDINGVFDIINKIRNCINELYNYKWNTERLIKNEDLELEKFEVVKTEDVEVINNIIIRKINNSLKSKFSLEVINFLKTNKIEKNLTCKGIDH